ncbi:MAG: GntR family transcriptional regulator [Stappiaceae bacterium]
MARPSFHAETLQALKQALPDVKLDPSAPIAPQIYDNIRRAIIFSNLLSGTPVNETAIGEYFGVSRSPVRAAYQQLAADGLIETRPQVGSSVAPRDEVRVREGAIIRRALECEVVEILARRQVDLSALRRHLSSQQIAIEDDDVEAFYLADESFHAGLAFCADMPSAWRLAQSVKGHTDRARMELMSRIEHRTLRAYEEHVQLLELIRDGDVQGARKAIAKHIDSVFDAAGRPIAINAE